MDKNDDHTFVIESGIDLYDKSPRNRGGKWKALALKMSAPRMNSNNGHIQWIYDSVSHTAEGTVLNSKEATALSNALSRAGFKSATRKNGDGGFRVWRIK